MDDDRFKRLNDELNSLKDKLINTENSLSERTQRCSLLVTALNMFVLSTVSCILL